MVDCSVKKRFEIVDAAGRRWARTMTRIKAAKIVEMLWTTRGLVCTAKELQGGN